MVMRPIELCNITSFTGRRYHHPARRPSEQHRKPTGRSHCSDRASPDSLYLPLLGPDVACKHGVAQVTAMDGSDGGGCFRSGAIAYASCIAPVEDLNPLGFADGIESR